MPFFSVFRRFLQNKQMNREACPFVTSLKKINFRTARLQKHTNRIALEDTVKRAYSAFFKCSMTIEAALALPLFVFAICILIYPLKIIDAEIRYQASLEELTKSLTAYAYLECTASGLIGENISDYSGMITGALTAADIIAAADSDVLGITVPMEMSLPSKENDMVKVTVVSDLSLPFSKVINTDDILVEFISQRRTWTGRHGGAGRAYGENEQENDGENDIEDEEDCNVWVAKNSATSGRYHLSLECHYISNKVTAVPASSVSELRSADGRKYKPCSSCHPGLNGIVFIFSSGNFYHATEECRAIQSYAVEMKKTEAEERGLSPCSYCLAHYR